MGLQLAARGEKNGKRPAVVAVARKLTVLLHRLWVKRAQQPAQSSADGSGAQSGGQRESERNVSRADFALQITNV